VLKVVGSVILSFLEALFFREVGVFVDFTKGMGTVDSTPVERFSTRKGPVMLIALVGHPIVCEPKAAAAHFRGRA
jgi:hypothetical protein